METIVHLMRHGQVENPGHVLYERLPGFHLSEEGKEMARQAAPFFTGLPISHLRCSPLERTQETMAPVHELFPQLDVVLDQRLVEAGNKLAGQVMGSTAKAARKPKNWPLFLNPFRPSWGEAYETIATRMHSAIRDAAVAAGDGQAIIVSHQLPIWMARLSAEGRRLWHDPRKRQCSLCSVTSFHLVDGVITKIDYAEPVSSLLPGSPQVGF